MNREAICSALFAKLAGAATFKTVSRQFRMFSDVSPADQPALFLVQRSESVAVVPGLPSVSTLSFDALIYVSTHGDKAVAPASVLNPLIDAVIASMAPLGSSDKQTLGGLVQHAWVEGEIQTDEGLLQQQGYALIPIKVKAV